VKGFDALAYLDRKEAKRFDLFCQYAIAATVQRCGPPDWTGASRRPSGAGVLIGSALAASGPSRSSARSSSSRARDGCRRSSSHVHPGHGGRPGGDAVRHHGTELLHRFGLRVVGARHREAYRTIQRGDADLNDAGGAEAAITPLAIAGFANMKALSTRNDDPSTPRAPSTGRATASSSADGAGIVVLESLEHAERRGAKILVEVAGFGMSADAYHMTQPAPEGRGRSRPMRVAPGGCRGDGRADHPTSRARDLDAGGDSAEHRPSRACSAPRRGSWSSARPSP